MTIKPTITYLKFALPIVLIILLMEETSRENTFLHSMLSNLFKVNFMEDFLVHEASAPSKKGPGAG
jgi:hypothetical protein